MLVDADRIESCDNYKKTTTSQQSTKSAPSAIVRQFGTCARAMAASIADDHCNVNFFKKIQKSNSFRKNTTKKEERNSQNDIVVLNLADGGGMLGSLRRRSQSVRRRRDQLTAIL